MVTIDRVVEYDGSDTRSMMMYHVTSEEAGLTVSMGIDTITFTPSEDGAHPWFDNMINLHLITAEEDDSGEIISTEHKLILRDNYSEASDICDEFTSDDDDSSSQTFSCSSTVGGTPDTVIDFALVNDGTEDCGDGSDEPQDFDGDGTVDNWFDCNDDDSTTVSMNVVNDGSYDCLNAADEPGFDHCAFETPSWNHIRDWADHLAKFDIPIWWGPGRHGAGNNLFFMVLDPDGNKIEISAELELMDWDHPTRYWPHDRRTLNLWGNAWMRSQPQLRV